MKPEFFRSLTVREQAEFRAWAREHYTPGDPISELWHPIVVDECARMNLERWQVARGPIQRGGQPCRPGSSATS